MALGAIADRNKPGKGNVVRSKRRVFLASSGSMRRRATSQAAWCVLILALVATGFGQPRRNAVLLRACPVDRQSGKRGEQRSLFGREWLIGKGHIHEQWR